MNLENISKFPIKNCYHFHHWVGNISIRKRDVDFDEDNYSYTYKYMRLSARLSIKGGKVGAFRRNFKSNISDKIFRLFRFNKNLLLRKLRLL